MVGFTDTNVYTCAPIPAFPVEPKFIRNYLGCEGGEPAGGELCVPEGYAFGTTYPLTTDAAATLFEDVDLAGCGCMAAYNQGAGCYSAAQPFLLLGDETMSDVYFLNVAGTCATEL